MRTVIPVRRHINGAMFCLRHHSCGLHRPLLEHIRFFLKKSGTSEGIRTLNILVLSETALPVGLRKLKKYLSMVAVDGYAPPPPASKAGVLLLYETAVCGPTRGIRTLTHLALRELTLPIGLPWDCGGESGT